MARLAAGAAAAPAAGPRAGHRRHQHLPQARPGLRVVAARRARVARAWQAVLPPAPHALLAWAWPRRAARSAARATPVRRHAWDTAVRGSSAVARGHRLRRPHRAVQRTRSAGLRALRAVGHHQRVCPRGDQQGQHPLPLRGLAAAPTDWRTALGDPPGAPAPTPLPRQHAADARTSVAA